MTVRWGVVGPGKIAAQFAEGMALVDDAEIVAVASRSVERAHAYGDRFDVARRYGDYESLAADPGVDVVYVATPQSRHSTDSMMYLEAGKHVLCEKPFAVDARQAEDVVAFARASGLFLMEAMWTRFLPAYRVLTELLADEAIGEPLVVEADFGLRLDVDPAHRLFDLGRAGGALLDLGIYPVQLCSLVLGEPQRVRADGSIGETGVDETVSAVLRHADDRFGVVKASIRAPLACTARITGTLGAISLPAMMHCPQSLTVQMLGGTRHIEAAYEGEGLRFQVEEVQRCLDEGRMESDVMPLDETVVVARTLDAIRRDFAPASDSGART